MANRATAALALKKQTAFGALAVAPFTLIPFSTHTLKKAPAGVIDDDTIRASRAGGDRRAREWNVGGGIVVNMRDADYAPLLESAFFNAIATGVLKQANTPTYLTIEDRQTDAAYAAVFKDMLCSRFQLDASLGALVRGTFDFLGTDAAVSGTASASPTAASSNEPMDGFNGSLQVDAGAVEVTEASFTIDNRVRASYALFDRNPQRLPYNTYQVSGQLTAAFVDASWHTKLLAGTRFALELEFTFGGATHTWLLPRCIVTDRDAAITTNEERFENISFAADYDATEATAVKLTIA